MFGVHTDSKDMGTAVSTSTSPKNVATFGQYLYKIQLYEKEGINVNATLKKLKADLKFQTESEVLVPGKIPSNRITYLGLTKNNILCNQ